jgi:hypothetical protein
MHEYLEAEFIVSEFSGRSIPKTEALTANFPHVQGKGKRGFPSSVTGEREGSKLKIWIGTSI